MFICLFLKVLFSQLHRSRSAPRNLRANSSRRSSLKILLDNTTLSSYGVFNTLYYTQCVTTRNRVMETEVFENLRLELRRGSLTIAVLAQLRTELYGYALRKALADYGLAIDENTLYPLLRRLETQGLLVSHWREEEKRNK